MPDSRTGTDNIQDEPETVCGGRKKSRKKTKTKIKHISWQCVKGTQETERISNDRSQKLKKYCVTIKSVTHHAAIKI